jgi:hypothetical protein
MKNSRRTKTSKRRSKRKLKGGLTFEDELQRKVYALDSFISAVNPLQTDDQSRSSVSKQHLKYINAENITHKDIQVYILSEEVIQHFKNKCDLLKEYVTDITYIIDLHNDLVHPNTKEKLKEHLAKIDCAIDKNAASDLYNEKIAEFAGGRKTRRQRRKRT